MCKACDENSRGVDRPNNNMNQHGMYPFENGKQTLEGDLGAGGA